MRIGIGHFKGVVADLLMGCDIIVVISPKVNDRILTGEGIMADHGLAKLPDQLNLTIVCIFNNIIGKNNPGGVTEITVKTIVPIFIVSGAISNQFVVTDGYYRSRIVKSGR